MPVTRKPLTRLALTSPGRRRIRSGMIGLLDSRLDGDERRHQQRGERADLEDGCGQPAVRGHLDDRVDRAHQRGGDEQRAEPVHAVSEAEPAVGADQRLAERERGEADREVDEEDPVPAQRLGEQAAGEEPERASGHRHEDVGAHRAGSLGDPRELGDDDREDHRRLRGRADALEEARCDQRPLRRGDAAQERRDRERDHAAEEHALSPGQVAEPAGQEQQAAERHEERVDDPGQVRLAEAEVLLDRRERDVHDRDVEDDHQLREADDEQRCPAAAIGGEAGNEVHVRSLVGALGSS